MPKKPITVRFENRYKKRDWTLEACEKLSGEAFKLYYYFNTHLDREIVPVNETIMKKTNLNKEEYENAFDELVNNGYVVQINQSEFIFYENPTTA